MVTSAWQSSYMTWLMHKPRFKCTCLKVFDLSEIDKSLNVSALLRHEQTDIRCTGSEHRLGVALRVASARQRLWGDVGTIMLFIRKLPWTVRSVSIARVLGGKPLSRPLQV